MYEPGKVVIGPYEIILSTILSESDYPTPGFTHYGYSTFGAGTRHIRVETKGMDHHYVCGFRSSWYVDISPIKNEFVIPNGIECVSGRWSFIITSREFHMDYNYYSKFRAVFFFETEEDALIFKMNI